MTCPACGGDRTHHSRLRGWREHVRRLVTRRVPYRCHDCQWRGWRRDDGWPQPDPIIREIQPDLTDAELDDIDPRDDRAAKT